MATQSKDLWTLVWGKPYIDAGSLAEAVADHVQRPSLDFRTRLLIRDSVDALKDHWGPNRLYDWLYRCPAREQIESICREPLGEPGFPTIKERLMDKVDPEVVRQLFRHLGTNLHHPVRIDVGGAISLIMPGYLHRDTEDIDVANEVPREIRDQHALLAELRRLYGLYFGHFQSHYLPSGWETRLHYLDRFGDLTVYLADVYDVFLGKLVSIREKDVGDLRVLLPQLDKQVLTQRLKQTMTSMLAAEDLR